MMIVLPRITAFSDSDYANDMPSRRSRTGTLFLLNGGPVAWLSQKQTTISTSTSEAECGAAFAAAKQAVHLRRLMGDIGFPSLSPTRIYVDNVAVIHYANDPSATQKRSKHWDIQYLWLAEKTAAKETSLKQVASEDQAADLMTKGQTRDRFNRNLKQIGMN